MTKITMFNLFRSSSSLSIVHLVSNSAIQVFVAFATNIILVRSISPEVFGSFAILVAGISLVFSILSLRLGITVINTSAKNYDNFFESKMNSIFLLEILCIFIVSLVVLLFTNHLQFWAIVVLLALSTQHFVDYIKIFFERGMNYPVLAKIETYSRLFGHFFAIAAIYFFPSKGFEILILREFVTAASLLFTLWLKNGLIPFSLALPTPKTFLEITKKIKGIWFEGALEQSFTRLTLIGASYVSNSAGVGIFSQSMRLSYLLDQFISPVYARFSLNWFSRTESFNKRLSVMYFMIFALLIINSLVVIFLYYFIESIVLLLYGEQWADVASTMIYLFGLIIFRSPFEALKAYCYSQKILNIVYVARVIQFAILGLAIFANFEFFGEGINSVSIALGFSYGLGFLLLIVLVPIIELKRK